MAEVVWDDIKTKGDIKMKNFFQKIWDFICFWKKESKTVPVIPDIKPKEAITKCSCDLTKPLVVPLAQHGTESEVDLWLSLGGAPECGNTGFPIDVRFRLSRPSGNYWCYAPFVRSGLVQYKDGKLMATCGVFEGQSYHPFYMSAHNQGTHMEGVKVVPGTWYPRDGPTFVYFEARDK